MGIYATKQNWVVVPNDGAYVKRPDLGTLRIEERSTPNELVLAIIVTDCPDCVEHANSTASLMAGAPLLYRELAHLVRLLEPLEEAGNLAVPGLATLNGARAALALARGEAQ